MGDAGVLPLPSSSVGVHGSAPAEGPTENSLGPVQKPDTRAPLQSGPVPAAPSLTKTQTEWAQAAPLQTGVGPTPTTQPVAEPVEWGQLYRRHADFVWRSLRRMGLSSEDSQDALHEVFLVVQRRRKSFDPNRGSERSWLFGIAANVTRAEKRRKRPLPHPDSQLCYEGRDSSPGQLLGESSWSNADGQASAAKRQLRAALQKAVNDLPPEHRAVFSMFEVEGIDGQSIATELEIPIGTVYSRLHHARNRLKIALQNFRQNRGEDR